MPRPGTWLSTYRWSQYRPAAVPSISPRLDEETEACCHTRPARGEEGHTRGDTPEREGGAASEPRTLLDRGPSLPVLTRLALPAGWGRCGDGSGGRAPDVFPGPPGSAVRPRGRRSLRPPTSTAGAHPPQAGCPRQAPNERDKQDKR